MAVMSISLPQGLLTEVEEKVEEYGYSGRSDLTREALRSFLDDSTDDALSGNVVATVTVVLREGSDAQHGLTDILHKYRSDVVDRSHACIDDGMCTEVLVVESEVDVVKSIVGEVRSKDGVLGVDYTAEPLPELR